MIRHLEERDYDPVITVIDEWWGGRKMSHLLPRVFFIHFRPTSFAIEEGGSVIGFLAGFVSQTNPEQAYIYFVGIYPVHRVVWGASFTSTSSILSGAWAAIQCAVSRHQ